MEIMVQRCNNITCSPTTPPPSIDQEEADQVRRGPWTVDEDLTLINYIADHGEGRWNSLARAAGLKRTGKSCRLRWLNYLRPDVKRGNFTAEEQLLILELHSRWGNRWSKIAQHLPGRTDNEIKNYWRTRVQKHAKQLNCDVNSKKFKDTMRYLWMPRLVERMQAGNDNRYSTDASSVVSGLTMTTCLENSSLDSLTSESYDESHCIKMYTNETIDSGDWIQEPDQGLCFEPTHASQFQDQELGGWVQGFSEGLNENLWSLEDIWRMQ